MSIYNYHRRPTREVRVGKTGVGGENPVRLQSMTNTRTDDVDASTRQILTIAEAGGELVRLTTQGEREARAMDAISRKVRSAGCDVPLVADVHFNREAAMIDALYCEKVRINPGNFADAPRGGISREWSDEEYRQALDNVRQKLLPLLEICRRRSVALRLGVNHGSLSERIMSRYGDTPQGMVESALEYLRILRGEDFHDVIISIKSSNPTVMVSTVELLARRMEEEGMDYPLHLGVTEAGEGDDGRIKSAVGIGSLLALGLGDTIRVSLSEPPEAEIPVAAALRDYIAARKSHAPVEEPAGKVENLRVSDRILVAGVDIPLSEIDAVAADAASAPEAVTGEDTLLLSSTHANAPGEIASFIHRLRLLGRKNPVIIHLTYPDTDPQLVKLKAAADFGLLLLKGYGDGLVLTAKALNDDERGQLLLDILQATRLRISKTEFISCPGCGRTLFDLSATVAEVKRRFAKFKNLKIGVMGCIVNGPGEMADADYGYVGAGPGRVSIYRRRTPVVKNIPAAEALERLEEIILADLSAG